MAEASFAARTYWYICAALIVLTVLTVGVSFAPLAGAWHLALGLGIAAIKALLVILFFMHVLVSSRLTWIVICVSCFWYSILVVLTLSEYFSRELVPYTPGH